MYDYPRKPKNDLLSLSWLEAQDNGKTSNEASGLNIEDEEV